MYKCACEWQPKGKGQKVNKVSKRKKKKKKKENIIIIIILVTADYKYIRQSIDIVSRNI